MVPYSWVMRYGMPPWNEGTGKNDPQLIAHLREFNNIFFQNGKVKLEKEVAGSGKKITYARVTSPIHVTDQLLYSLAIQGYPIKYVDSTSYLFNPDSGQPISQKLSKQADRLKQILQKFYVKKDGQANDDFVKNFNKKFQSPLIDGELCNMRWIILF